MLLSNSLKNHYRNCAKPFRRISGTKDNISEWFKKPQYPITYFFFKNNENTSPCRSIMIPCENGVYCITAANLTMEKFFVGFPSCVDTSSLFSSFADRESKQQVKKRNPLGRLSETWYIQRIFYKCRTSWKIYFPRQRDTPETRLLQHKLGHKTMFPYYLLFV